VRDRGLAVAIPAPFPFTPAFLPSYIPTVLEPEAFTGRLDPMLHRPFDDGQPLLRLELFVSHISAQQRRTHQALRRTLSMGSVKHTVCEVMLICV
jgi:hypothetical protein